MEEAHVDQDPGGVVLDVLGVLGAVVGVVPLVRGQQQLHQHVRNIRLVQRCVVAGVECDAGQRLQQKAKKVLQKKRVCAMPED